MADSRVSKLDLQRGITCWECDQSDRCVSAEICYAFNEKPASGERVEGEMTKEQFLDKWPEHEKGWTHRAMAAYNSGEGGAEQQWRKCLGALGLEVEPSIVRDVAKCADAYLAEKAAYQLAERDAELQNWKAAHAQREKEAIEDAILVGDMREHIHELESREQRLREALRESTWMLTNLAGLAQRSGHNVEHVDKQVEVNRLLLEALNPSPAKESNNG